MISQANIRQVASILLLVSKHTAKSQSNIRVVTHNYQLGQKYPNLPIRLTLANWQSYLSIYLSIYLSFIYLGVCLRMRRRRRRGWDQTQVDIDIPTKLVGAKRPSTDHLVRPYVCPYVHSRSSTCF